MGAGIAARLRNAGHKVVAYDADATVSEAASLEALVGALPPPRIIWIMVPAGAATASVAEALIALLESGDIIIEGGNSYYRDSVQRAALAGERGIEFLDVGTSGGIWGQEGGFCLMVGGSRATFDLVEPLLAALAPAGGYAYLGPSGAGHYAKMVHNAIEYGLLQAYAEGFALLQAADAPYDLAAVSQLWNNGGVVRSWLLELAARSFGRDPQLSALHGYVDDSGEGRWAVTEAVERGVPLEAISVALYARFSSRDPDSFAMRFIAAMRNEFGGHAVRET
jgi:6-phosphogluconate dehydrogenase